MGWNYRIVKKGGYLGVHGVYYGEHGNIQGMDQDPNAPTAETRAELRTKLELMLEALNKPILDYDKVNAKDSIAHDVNGRGDRPC
jgi:hypothetical protein